MRSSEGKEKKRGTEEGRRDDVRSAEDVSGGARTIPDSSYFKWTALVTACFLSLSPSAPSRLASPLTSPSFCHNDEGFMRITKLPTLAQKKCSKAAGCFFFLMQTCIDIYCEAKNEIYFKILSLMLLCNQVCQFSLSEVVRKKAKRGRRNREKHFILPSTFQF